MSISKIRPQIVYHYCSLDTFYQIISSSTIRLSNISKSNDSEEIMYILPHVKKYCNKIFMEYNSYLDEEFKIKKNSINSFFDNIFNELSLSFYVICFTEEADLLSQWRGYANNACGVSIGFSTDCLYPLTCGISSNYNFSQVKYSLDELYDQITVYTKEKIKKNFTNDSKKNSIVLMNIINAIISMLLYNSVLYKNPNFSEEKEWRLIFNPFGNIRRIKDKTSYYDRMTELFYDKLEDGGFVKNRMTFHTTDNKIISHIDLSFNDIKRLFIKEIVIGSKAQIKDLDLELFLCSNGYNPLHINIRNSDIPYR